MKSMALLIFMILTGYPTFCRSHSNKDLQAAQIETPEQMISIYSMVFDDLTTFGKFETKELKEKPSLWVLFQPDCKSCETQFRELDCLPDHVQQISVGFWGTREKLNKTVRLSQFKGKKLIANTKFEKIVNLKLTPTILVVDKRGVIQNKIYALTECQKLKTYFELDDVEILKRSQVTN